MNPLKYSSGMLSMGGLFDWFRGLGGPWKQTQDHLQSFVKTVIAHATEKLIELISIVEQKLSEGRGSLKGMTQLCIL